MRKTGMITGAGSGIGRATALRLAAAGYQVILVGRHQDNLEATKAQATAGMGEMIVAPADVSDPGSVYELFDSVKTKIGRLDVVFNNAGTNTRGSLIDELAVEEWERVISVNVTGAFLVARAAFALMRTQKPQGGRIINNGSVSAHVPRPGSVAYTVSKHAITGLTRTLSLDGRPFDIACGQIDIGNAATEMAAQIAKGVPQADGSRRGEDTMRVEDVADAVAYMADLPLEANVQFITLMATKMPFVGRG